jgi:hypothetical protein
LKAREDVNAIHSGRYGIAATLAAQAAAALSRRAHLELPRCRSAEEGVRLLPSSEYPAAIPDGLSRRPLRTSETYHREAFRL